MFFGIYDLNPGTNKIKKGVVYVYKSRFVLIISLNFVINAHLIFAHTSLCTSFWTYHACPIPWPARYPKLISLQLSLSNGTWKSVSHTTLVYTILVYKGPLSFLELLLEEREVVIQVCLHSRPLGPMLIGSLLQRSRYLVSHALFAKGLN